ncbi:MAG: NADH-quinone oxidoreductase subunit M [Candidatus Marsarchaeota archaeon]|nr:NADH-quinone oxidoreductase subunit M [Candidatus Marsarchaeota archaeon]MCL5412875.1 NADH-quinone oxidoreductase subunit M [Candidatus Marsarchaeota archaeon]
MLPILPLIILIPFAAIAAELMMDRHHSYQISFVASLASFLLVAFTVYYAYVHGSASLSFSSMYVPSLNLHFSLQVTELSLMLLLMTSIVFLAASVVGKYFIGSKKRMYNIIFLVSEGASLGVFVSANLFLFYVFWEIAEIMFFFIIFLYGGYNRRYASIKFIIYSLFSSLLLLIGIMLLYSSITPHTFNINGIIAAGGSISASTQTIILALLLVSFLIKMPVFPFHGWLPDAHTEAPTTGSMILAGVLLKFGGYGLFLMLLMLPIASHYAPYLFVVFLLSTVYSAFACMTQSNIKRLIAYTSITDMGIVGIGLSAMNTFGYNGGFYAMFNHGIAIALLFLIAGTLDHLYGTLEIDRIKGVIKNFPALSYLFIIGTFTAVGIPLTSGFVADLLLFFGSVKAFGIFGVLPLAGILIIGAALFWVIERTFMNSSTAVEPYNPLDRNVVASGVFLIATAILFGILPFILLGIT